MDHNTSTPLPPENDIEKMAQAVYAQLLKTNNRQDKSIGKNLMTLGITVLLFISLGIFRSSVSGIILLVLIIFIHESGHFIGMKLLKYKDIQMFFIPLFGAAVSGQETSPSASRKAIVSLLGPVPGILMGIGTGIAFMTTHNPILGEATSFFLFLNTLNLLPFYPLDGGRLVDALLFSRNPRIEIIFKIVTTLALAYFAIKFKELFAGIFAGLIFMSLRSTYTTASVAHEIKKTTNRINANLPNEAPYEFVYNIVGLLRKKLPAEQWKVGTMTILTTGIWQRIRNKPCKLLPTVALILLYVFFLMLGIISFITFEYHRLTNTL